MVFVEQAVRVSALPARAVRKLCSSEQPSVRVDKVLASSPQPYPEIRPAFLEVSSVEIGVGFRFDFGVSRDTCLCRYLQGDESAFFVFGGEDPVVFADRVPISVSNP